MRIMITGFGRRSLTTCYGMLDSGCIRKDAVMTLETTTLSTDDVLAAAFAQRIINLANAHGATIEEAIGDYGPGWARDVDAIGAADRAYFERGHMLLEHFLVVESEPFLTGADFADWYVKRFARRHRLTSPIVEVVDGYVASTDQSRYIALVPRTQ
jgi:hypothetical protein